MGIVSEWRRQAVRAAGASVVAPLVLLVAAAGVASGGSFGGLGSLGQVASGPTLPETGLVARADTSLSDAEIVGADLSAPPAPPAPAATGEDGTELARAAPAAPPPSVPGPVLETARPSPPTAVPAPPGPQARTPGQAPTQPAQEPARPEVLGEVVDTTRGLVEGLPGPVGPLGSDLIDLLLGGPAPR